MAKALPFKKIVKKRRKHFDRHQSDVVIRVSKSWRRPKGIDSCVRRKFRGQIPMPNVGYRSAKATRGKTRNGFYVARICNVKDLEALMMHNRAFMVEIAHGVSSKNRKTIVERADQLDIRVNNRAARIRTQDEE